MAAPREPLEEINAALDRLNANKDHSALAAAAVHLQGCHLVIFCDASRRGYGAYDIWRFAKAHQAEAAAENCSHSKFTLRDSVSRLEHGQVAEQAVAIVSAVARKHQARAAAAAGADGAAGEGPKARPSPARPREGAAAGGGAADVDDDFAAFASPPESKKQKKEEGLSPTRRVFTPGPRVAEPPAPVSALPLATTAPLTAAQPPAAARAALPPRYADAQRVKALEEQLSEAQRNQTRMSRRFKALERAHEAQHAAFEALRADCASLRASLCAALKAAAAACDAAPPGGAA
jgi:hypothetical protein